MIAFEQIVNVGEVSQGCLWDQQETRKESIVLDRLINLFLVHVITYLII
jgi:hypothetical protein